jgi:drug/metabolite transporter (DMT)-like permease
MAGGNLWRGVAFALLAGMIWGMVFVAPVLLPEYSPASLAFGRYLAFALVALVVAWSDRARLRQLQRADWVRALQLTLVGNIVYYLFLSSAIQTSGVPLASVLIGTLPVVIAVTANWHQRTLPWRQLLPSLALMACGIALVNLAEWRLLSAGAGAGYLLGGALALVAVAAWTWYPIHNAAWLQTNTQHLPSTWTTAQGVATLPLAMLGWVGMGLWQGAQGGDWVYGLGPRPGYYLGLMLAIGLLASWVGTWAWSRASTLLPTALSGQLIVFETLAALTYGYMHRGERPDATAMLGIALLVAGVMVGVRAFHRQQGPKTS